MAEVYFSGQGKIYVGTRDGVGSVAKYRHVGNVPSLTLTLETDVVEHKEATTGQRLTDLRLTRERSAGLSIAVEEFSLQNLQTLLYGTTSQVATNSVADEILYDPVATGTLQVETSTVDAASGITGDGNIQINVTAEGMNNSPKTIQVAVTSASESTEDLLAVALRAGLSGDGDIGGFFTITGATNQIIATTKIPAANDVTMNIDLDGPNSTATGMNDVPVSANTTPGVIANDIVETANSHLTVVTNVKDSTGSPKTLTAGVNYNVIDLAGGMIQFIDLETGGPYVEPFTTSYTWATHDLVQMFRQPPVERFLQFSGLNTADGDEAVIVELYRVVFDPVGSMELINDEIAQYELEGSILFDDTRDSDATLGGFGRIIRPQ